MLQIIDTANAEQRNIDAGLTDVVRESALLDKQLTSRREDVAAVEEKVKIQDRLLVMGRDQYQKLLTERARVWRDISKAKNILDSESGGVGQDSVELAATVAHLEAELHAERARVSALEVEGDKRLNVHRWEQLQDTDPTK